jgi:hypothetical protein
MDLQCEVCKTIFRIQDGLVPAGEKVRFTCKRCRSAGGSFAEDGFSKTATVSAVAHPRLDPPDQNGNRLTKRRILNSIGELPAMPQVITEIQNPYPCGSGGRGLQKMEVPRPNDKCDRLASFAVKFRQ